MKHIAIAALWFVSVWFAYELLVSVAGAPRSVGPVLGTIGAVIGLLMVQRDRAVNVSLRSGERTFVGRPVTPR